MTEPIVGAAQPPPDLGLELFDTAADELGRLIETVGTERADQAISFAVRAAAFDTGAIEGLYSTNAV